MTGLIDSRTGEYIEAKKGEKLYHYRFGPLTILDIDNNNVSVTMDDPNGIARGLLSVDTNSPKKFPIASLGKWLFLTKDEIYETQVSFPSPSGLLFRSVLHNHYIQSETLDKKSTPSKIKEKKEIGKLDNDEAQKEELRSTISNEIKLLKEGIESKKNKIKRFREYLESKTNENMPLKEFIESKKNDERDLSDTLSKYEKQISTITYEINSLESEQTPAILKDNQPKIKKLEEEKVELTSKIDTVKEDIKKLDTKIKDKQMEIDTVNEDIKKLKTQISEKKMEIDTDEESIRELNKQIEDI